LPSQGREVWRNLVIAARACRSHSLPLASSPVFGFFDHMEENTGSAQKDPRKERLAKALRDNLRRRKAQARERVADADPEDQSGQGSEPKV
jgi:hypothetical protein